MQQTDEKLVAEFLQGNQAALEILFERYFKAIFNFVFQLVGEQEVSQDLAQEVFFKAWKNLKTFDQNKKFSTWIFAIAKNAAYDFLKKKKALPFSRFENENEDGEDFFQHLEDTAIQTGHQLHFALDSKKTAKQMLAELDSNERVIVLLYHGQGFSLTEIAAILGKSPNTVKSTYRRARLFLRRQFSWDKV